MRDRSLEDMRNFLSSFTSSSTVLTQKRVSSTSPSGSELRPKRFQSHPAVRRLLGTRRPSAGSNPARPSRPRPRRRRVPETQSALDPEGQFRRVLRRGARRYVEVTFSDAAVAGRHAEEACERPNIRRLPTSVTSNECGQSDEVDRHRFGAETPKVREGQAGDSHCCWALCFALPVDRRVELAVPG